MGKAPLTAYNLLKREPEKSVLHSFDESCPFIVECDASEVAIAATLNLRGRPVTLMLRTLQGSELHYPSVEKGSTAIIEAVCKWCHLLAVRHFTHITDQCSVAFMLGNQKCSKIKNNKIQDWRLELASFCYTVKYRPRKDNVAPDSFTRAFLSSLHLTWMIFTTPCVTLVKPRCYTLCAQRIYHI